MRATIDFWDDQNDVYRVMLRPGQRLEARLTGAPGGTRVFLWSPGTRTVEGLSVAVQQRRVAQSAHRGGAEVLVYRAPRARVGDGWYYLHVKSTAPGFGRYALRYAKR